ncbi:2-dehydro-3-deoxyphosphogluconate aldolase [Enterococcus faecium]
MSITNFPELTIILRGYSFEEAMFVMEELAAMNTSVGIEVTTNNDDFARIITEGNKKFGQQLLIGAGTVLTFSQADQAIAGGAKFLLGPKNFQHQFFRWLKNVGW